MQIASKQLKQIIKEELEGLLLEKNFDGKTGFPLNQKAAKMVQKRGNEDALYGKYKRAVDKIAAGKMIPKEIERVLYRTIYPSEGHEIPQEWTKLDDEGNPIGATVAGMPEDPKPKTAADMFNVQDDPFRAKEEPAKEEPASTQKLIQSATSQLMQVLPQLPPDLEKRVEPQFGKIIEFLNNVSRIAEKMASEKK